MKKVIIVLPIGGGSWGYKVPGDGEKIHFGGSTPQEAIESAWRRALCRDVDIVHICRETGIEETTVRRGKESVY